MECNGKEWQRMAWHCMTWIRTDSRRLAPWHGIAWRGLGRADNGDNDDDDASKGDDDADHGHGMAMAWPWPIWQSRQTPFRVDAPAPEASTLAVMGRISTGSCQEQNMFTPAL